LNATPHWLQGISQAGPIQPSFYRTCAQVGGNL
jgi:hypothetical protein